ncbi:MAG: hypothetical protein ACOWYE_15215 [Desulfatiglandales bacterium]
MKIIYLNKHYLTFKWAVSKEWKDKNDLYQSIQYKIGILTEEYALSERDIVDHLFADYWERGHYRRQPNYPGSIARPLDGNWIGIE